MTKTLGDIDFLSLLPSSISGDGKMQAAAQALNGEFAKVTEAIEGLILYDEIDSLPEPILKHLAFQWHVDFWDDRLSMDKKRILVKQAYPWHRKKGTPVAVEMVVQDVLGGGYVKEWWEYGGEPYHFKVFSNQPPEDAEVMSQLTQAINLAKNERSVLDGIDNPVSITGDIFFSGLLMTGAVLSLIEE